VCPAYIGLHETPVYIQFIHPALQALKFEHSRYTNLYMFRVLVSFKDKKFEVKKTNSTVSYRRFPMFSVITNIYNKKTKGPTLTEFFTAAGKLKKFVFDN
jgi:hypothetical protein